MKEERIKSGIPGLDLMLGGGFVKGSVTTVAGATGSGRTLFLSQFLYKGAQSGEPGLFLSFEVQKESLYLNLESFGFDFEEMENKQKIVFIEYPQNELSAFVEQESALKDLIYTLGIKRVVIDPITPYALLFSNPEERKLAALNFVNVIKGWKVTALISSDIFPGSELIPSTPSGIELFCDGFIHILFQRNEGKRNRYIEIIKMRGCNHEHELRQLIIGKNGLLVLHEKEKKKSDKNEY
jgi:circadian clock protein KaiC